MSVPVDSGVICLLKRFINSIIKMLRTKSRSLESQTFFFLPEEYKWNKVRKMSCITGFFLIFNLDLLSSGSLLSIMLKISSKILSDLARFAAILEQKLPLWLICILKFSLHIYVWCYWMDVISTFLTYFSLLTSDISQPLYLPIFLRHFTDYKFCMHVLIF